MSDPRDSHIQLHLPNPQILATFFACLQKTSLYVALRSLHVPLQHTQARLHTKSVHKLAKHITHLLLSAIAVSRVYAKQLIWIYIYSLVDILSTTLLVPGLAAARGNKAQTAAQRRQELPLSKDRAMQWVGGKKSSSARNRGDDGQQG